MALTNYAALCVAVGDWLSRADLDQQIPDFITLAEATLNKVIRSTRMTANSDVTINAGTRKAALPDTLLEPIYVTLKTDEDYPLEAVSPEQLVALRRSRMRAQGTPRFYAIVGRSLEVTPTPSSQMTLDVAYYQAIPSLVADGDTNWLLQYEPDLYLYTALLHAASFLTDQDRSTLFSSLLVNQVSAAVQTNTTISLDSRTAGPSLTSPSDLAK
jgi:hypothetical protein